MLKPYHKPLWTINVWLMNPPKPTILLCLRQAMTHPKLPPLTTFSQGANPAASPLDNASGHWHDSTTTGPQRCCKKDTRKPLELLGNEPFHLTVFPSQPTWRKIMANDYFRSGNIREIMATRTLKETNVAILSDYFSFHQLRWIVMPSGLFDLLSCGTRLFELV